MKEFSLSNVLLFHVHGNEEFNQVCYYESFFGVFSTELNCIYLSLLQPFCYLWQIIFFEFIIRRLLVSYVTPLHCCTCIPITDILPLRKKSLDFKKQRKTNDRALSRTPAPQHQSGITFPAFHCSRKAPAEQFTGDLSSLEKTLRVNHNCLLDTVVAENWINMQSRRKMQVI